MKVTVKVKKEVEIKTLHVEAGASNWEDTEVNGSPDSEDGTLIPCKDGDYWKPIIDIETGQILNWEKGKTAYIHYKVCDDGRYFVKDKEGNTIFEKDGYVPTCMSPKEAGFGDYIIMDINENGFIQDWDADFSDFYNSEND
jgi:hypothetical protein